jgi:HSP20 family molecular chaperone IbpA
MGFFDDNDPFNSIVREFFGDLPIRRNGIRQKFIMGEDEDRTIDFVEDENNIYLVFELPGYHEKDISVIVKGKELEITAHKSNGENIQDYLHQKLRQGLHLKKQLPNFVNPKDFSYTMKNGVLEMIFIKFKGGNINEQ